MKLGIDFGLVVGIKEGVVWWRSEKAIVFSRYSDANIPLCEEKGGTAL